ncbi:carboxypeptidase-like regulatory domain-containing protein [Geothrix sp. PMB-07]|uniref:TonB-dependent receptor n=1 Tax=Geothrix sp. PMB-07 TaxID=3068640 RepID=UPI002740EF97|nr:carboxypeptidase-like regulatory domain-containing protein [Geothrix sp. PMB-07]WLT30465.1 carboxypeptidase-like regulatory domain-containing protein [Geothrix sp. PMB-07]
MNRRTATLTLTALACCMVASAQTTSTAGAVRGVVRDKGGKVVSGATVGLRNRETGLTRTTSTAADGEYRVGLLPVGTYEITVSAPGMRTVKDANIQVLLGQNAIANFNIDRAEASAMVEVVGASAGVDAKQVNVITSVDSSTIEAVPLVTRNFTDVAKLSPGVVSGSGNRMVVEGGRQIFNAIQIDGASNNSAFFNEQRGGVYTPFIFGADTIKELQVVTNGFDVQYAQAGATVNAVTKTGTNEFGGSALYQIRRTSWSAKPQAVPYDPNHTFNTPANLQRFNDSTNVNFNVGGALIKDSLWYFVGVERFHKSITANPIPTTLSSTAGMTQTDFNNLVNSRLGQVLTNPNGLTLAQEFGNPGLGTPAHPYPMENTNTVYFGRLDYSLNENHRFVLRMNYQTMTDTLLNTSANSNNAESNNIPTVTNAISWVVEANDIWTNELFTESRLQIAREARPMRNNSVTGVPSIEVPTSASFMAFGTKTSTPRESNENTLQLFSATTWNHGDIQIKGGLDLMKVDVDNQFFQNNAGRFQFGTYGAAAAWANGTLAATASPTDPGGAITYSGAVSPYKGRIQMWTKTEGFFGQVQYSGLLDKRLTLTGGLRSINQSFSNNPAPNPNFQGLDQATSANALDPRFAFSYDLDGQGKTVIRGGYGSFTSPTPLLLHSNTMTGNGQIITNYSLSLARTGPTANLNTFNTGLLSANNLINGSAMRHLTDAELAALPAVTSSTSLWDPNNKLSRSKKTSLGIEHDLGNNLVLGLTATYVKYENLQRFENINLGQLNEGGTLIAGGYYNDGYASANNNWSNATANRPGFAIVGGRRVDFRPGNLAAGNPVGGFSDVYLVKTDGWGHYRGLSFSAKKTWDAKTGIIANVTYSKAQDTGSFERGTYTSANNNFSSELGASLTPNPQDPGSNYGYGDSDRRWVANVVAFFPIIWGIEGSVRGLYQSGLPYSAYLSPSGANSLDLVNGDGMNNHFAPGHTRGDLRQPGYTQFDVRLSRNFKVYGKVEVEGIVDIYNLLNKAEFSVPSPAGYTINTSAGLPNGAFGQLGGVNKDRTRELQLGIRVKF